MENFSKDTLFNDLPQNIKQKIMSIRKLGSEIPKQYTFAPLPNFDYIVVPSTKQLGKDFMRIASTKLDKEIDVTESLKKKADEFNEFVNTYKTEINETDFISEMEKTIGLMENKFERMCRKTDLY